MRLRIEKPVYGGAGLARGTEGSAAGKTLFVPLTLPGELVDAHITGDRRSFAEAELDTVLEPSLARTTPPCPYYGVCGGCQYQHATYPQQVKIKADILRETLERAHLPGLPPINTVHAEPWEYRNRIRLVVNRQPFSLGYRERRSHKTLAVDQCPIAAPLLQVAMRAAARAGESLGLADLCDEIEFFTDGSEEHLLISLHGERPTRQAAQSVSRIGTALQTELPQLRGVGLFSAVAGKQALVAHWGEPFLNYAAAGFSYRVSLGSFFQVNRYLVDALVELATSAQSGTLAWDLYSGAGLFARALSGSFDRVVAVEGSPFSSRDLAHNLAGTPHRAVACGTLEFLRRKQQGSPDLILVDPPRAGLGKEIAPLLAAGGARRIVYVSCDPATLSRDLQVLLQSGYHPLNITMVDLFPQTFHLESVTVLERN